MDLAGLYPWLVFLHVLASFAFAIAHGVSIFVAYRVPRERDPARIRALLDLSLVSLYAVYASLLAVLVTGFAVGILGGHLGRGWFWVSVVILLGMVVVMYALASRYYARVRHAVGLASYLDKKDAPPPVPLDPPELDALLRTRRPDVIALTGFGAFVGLVWLMMFQPF